MIEVCNCHDLPMVLLESGCTVAQRNNSWWAATDAAVSPSKGSDNSRKHAMAIWRNSSDCSEAGEYIPHELSRGPAGDSSSSNEDLMALDLDRGMSLRDALVAV